MRSASTIDRHGDASRSNELGIGNPSKRKAGPDGPKESPRPVEHQRKV